MSNKKDIVPVSDIFTFKYDGDLRYINIDTLITSQLHLSNLINEIKSELHPEYKLDIKVKPLPEGSWQMELMVILSTAQNLFTVENIKWAIETIIMSTIGIIGIRVTLKGKKPKEVIENKDDESVTIVGNKNTSIEVSKDIYRIKALMILLLN